MDTDKIIFLNLVLKLPEREKVVKMKIVMEPLRNS